MDESWLGAGLCRLFACHFSRSPYHGQEITRQQEEGTITLTPSLDSAQLIAQSPRAQSFKSSLKESEFPASKRDPRRTVEASQAPKRLQRGGEQARVVVSSESDNFLYSPSQTFLCVRMCVSCAGPTRASSGWWTRTHAHANLGP